MTTQGEHGELRDMLIEMRTQLGILVVQTSSQHSDHESRIRALEQRVDPPPASHGHQLEDHDHQLVDHETRMRKLERAVWLWAGAAAAGGGGVGAFLATVIGA